MCLKHEPCPRKECRPPYTARLMVTYHFHPEAGGDLDEIWQLVAADNPDTALRCVSPPDNVNLLHEHDGRN